MNLSGPAHARLALQVKPGLREWDLPSILTDEARRVPIHDQKDKSYLFNVHNGYFICLVFSYKVFEW